MATGDTSALSKLIQAGAYSWQGLKAAWSERAFKQELWVLALVAPLSCWLGEGPVEQTMLIGSWLLVIIVELLNSAIEAVVDRIGPETHELAGRAKDMGSAAVLCAIILAAFVWGMLIFA
ncbi:MAG: diacylglycerol kinase [Mariprofundaceae bacterium]